MSAAQSPALASPGVSKAPEAPAATGTPKATARHSSWAFLFAALALFSAALIYLLASGQYLRFLTPRLAWCLYVLLTFLVVWAVDVAVRKPYISMAGVVSKCLVVILPALLILVPHSAITGSSFDKFGGNQPLQIHFVENGTPISVDTTSNEIPGLDTAAKTITISNENFGSWYDLLQAQPTRFVGYRVTLTGFVHRVPTTLGKNQFVVARPLMTCCIEDISAFGLTSEYSKQASLGENSWVSATGTLATTKSKVNGSTVTLLKIDSVKKALQVTGYFYR